MARPKLVSQALTANRLSDGIVVFLASYGSWVDHLTDAAVAVDQVVADQMVEMGAIAEGASEVVGAYLIDVVKDDDGLRAAHIREAMRAAGPSVRQDLGKQSEGAAPLRDVA